MSVESNAAGDQYERTANVPSLNSFTWCCWIYSVTDSGVTEHFMNIDDGSDAGIEFQWTSGDALAVWDGRSSLSTFGSSPSRTGEWIFVAIKSNGTGGLLVRWATMDTPTFVTMTTAGSGNFASNPYEYSVSGDYAAFEPFLGRTAHAKLWDAELTDNELYLEMYSQLPVRLANLNCAFRVISASSITDIGPNARNATVNGTFSVAEDPPIDDFMWCPQWCLNQAPAAAAARYLSLAAGQLWRANNGLLVRA